MARCMRRFGLEVYHIRCDGENNLGNATVLCEPCYAKAPTLGISDKKPAPFTEETKKQAMGRAGYQCECTTPMGCH